MFYPGDPATLAATVDSLFRSAAEAPVLTDESTTAPKALIVPHAGYVYSGATAARAYALLASQRQRVRRVVLLGPVHRVPVRGLALPDADAFETPLGRVHIDADAVAALRDLPEVVSSRAAHAREHSLEVQLPLLQAALDDFRLLPLAVGDASAAEVAEVIDRLWGGPETLIVISSDLSHFLDYASAQAIDGSTVRQMLALEAGISHQQACGATPVNGMLLAARRRGMSAGLVAQCNSGDSSGDRDRVVGYASIAFHQPPPTASTTATSSASTLETVHVH
jgi:AmmeMemoRadiSam system protein B